MGVTAHASGEGRAACYDAGMDDYLSKPYTLEELAAVIRKWAGNAIRRQATRLDRGAARRSANVCELDGAILDGIRSLQSDGRPDLLDRIFAAYLDGSGKLMEQLADARQSRSLSKMRAAAHALKSSSGNIGATEFSKSAAELESACDELDESRAIELAKRMEATHKSVVAAVERNLEKKSA